MNQTTNYNLPQWEADDRIMRTDFNSAFSAIDTAVNGLSTAQTALAANLGTAAHNCRIASCSYTGNGTYGGQNKKTLTFAFYPLIVFVYNGDFDYCYSHAPMTMVRGHCFTRSEVMQNLDSTHLNYVGWNDKTVYWWNNENADYQNNKNGVQYYVCAIGYDKDAEDALAD